MTALGSGPAVFDARTLPEDDNVNPYAFCVALDGEWFVQKGKMIAYYGRIKFEALGVGALDRLVTANFNSPLYIQDWIVAQGKGRLLLADRGFDVNSYDLELGNLTIRAANLLAFQPGLDLKQSIVPGFVTLIGTGKFVAASNGAVHFVEPPIRVDPEALLGWADCPTPCHHFDTKYMRGALGMARRLTGLGGASGEEHQYDFVGSGTVLMQSSEISIDPNLIPTQAAAANQPAGQQGTPGIPGLPNLPGRLGRLLQ
ncbi:AIM24 family protein [Embleya sp. NPDC050154]|uniref:AIM24 family protein n=1 Tax=unclassified Embleya TaxID=2699296 RepID=UPI0037890235